jgi:hypothetical protein
MPNEYCPKCKTIKNLRPSVTFKEEKNKKGEVKRIMVTSYHCEECNSFIKSDEANDRIESLLDFVSR